MIVALRRVVLGALCVVVLGVVIAACGGAGSSSPATGSEQEETPATEEGQGASANGSTIAYISLSNDNSYSKNVLNGVETEAQNLGASLQTFEGGYSPEKQLAACQQITTAGTAKYAAIIMFPTTPAAAKPCGALAKAADMPVVAAGIFVGEGLSVKSVVPGVLAGVAPPVEENTQAIVNMVAKACEGRAPCKVGRLPTVKELPEYEAKMSEQLAVVLKENPNIEIAAEVEAPLEVGGDVEATNNLLQKVPDVEVIFSDSDQGPIGMAKAIEQAGKSHDNKTGIRLIADCSKPFVTMLKAGEGFGCYPLLPITEGENAAKLVGEAIEGKPVESISPLKVAGLPAEFTEENAGEYPEFDGQLIP